MILLRGKGVPNLAWIFPSSYPSWHLLLASKPCRQSWSSAIWVWSCVSELLSFYVLLHEPLLCFRLLRLGQILLLMILSSWPSWTCFYGAKVRRSPPVSCSQCCKSVVLAFPTWLTRGAMVPQSKLESLSTLSPLMPSCWRNSLYPFSVNCLPLSVTMA